MRMVFLDMTIVLLFEINILKKLKNGLNWPVFDFRIIQVLAPMSIHITCFIRKLGFCKRSSAALHKITLPVARSFHCFNSNHFQEINFNLQCRIAYARFQQAIAGEQPMAESSIAVITPPCTVPIRL